MRPKHRIAHLLFACTIVAESQVIAATRADNTAALVDGNTAFALDLYQRLQPRPGNLFYSPHSVSTALAMTLAGARGQTQKEMAGTLHLSLPPETLHPAFGDLQAHLHAAQAKGHITLSVANSLWGQRGEEFLDEFLKLTQRHYGAGINIVDYVKDTEGARQIINAWVEKKTHSKIKDLLAPSSLSRDTRLVLCNAIYFKGTWATKFNEPRTREADFHLKPGNIVRVPMMVQTEGSFRMKALDGLSAIDLPYQGNELSMIVLLPEAVDRLPALEKNLKPQSLKRWLGELAAAAESKVHVFLPKFRTASGFSLEKTLTAMGMPSAFKPGAADFSAMNGERDLFIDDVVHKALVEVNEEGTEAAGATAVAPRPTAGPPTSVAEFHADHPFLFLIRDNQTGSILFFGRIVDPTM